MIYQFGDCEEIVDANVVADWIALDEEGEIIFDENNIPVLDETMIAEYVAYLSTTYNTVGIERKFRATRGDIVTVSGGGYGNALDEKAEYEFLLNAFLNKESRSIHQRHGKKALMILEIPILRSIWAISICIIMWMVSL